MKIIEFLLLIVFCNIIPLWHLTDWQTGLKILLIIALSVGYFAILLHRERIPVENKRLRRLKKGICLLRLSGITAVVQVIVMLVEFSRIEMGLAAKIFTAVMSVIGIGIVFFGGFLGMISSSRQIKLTDHALLMMLWWFPVVNLVLIRKSRKKAESEYRFELCREELDNARAESEICKTKYPIVMVHGIFFRDWQIVNYWGRIPAALIKNGAEIHYGKQQSAQSVAASGMELKARIDAILAETGAEKVNIIAHSKGGLDSRYAITGCGLGDKVATLTTVNTPHNGVDMVDWLLERLPAGLQKQIEKKYNSMYRVLGDRAPDFMAGVHDLSPKGITAISAEMADDPRVSYRSIMTEMKGFFSAPFPLNISYFLIKRLNGANDGLVWNDSAVHGEHRLISPKGRRGISHGDVIDLMRENIDGYDVREFYVELVSDLKKQGF